MTGTVLGVDIGGTKLLAVALDASGATVAREERPRPRSGAAVVEAVVELAAGLAGPPVALGLGIAGLVSNDGVLRVSAHLPEIVEFPLRAELVGRLAVPVAVENDATAAAWAEATLGAAAGHDDAVVVSLGTGIGAGIVAGGSVQRGAHGFGGEAGHMIVDPDGPPCPCGRRGCWEQFASGTGLARLGRLAAASGGADAILARADGDPAAVRGEHVAAAAAEGDGPALAILEDFARWIALGLANLVALCDPSIVVLGGGVTERLDAMVLEPIRRHLGPLTFGSAHRPSVPVVPAALGGEAAAIGAGLLAGTSVAPP